jgi:hypothetical protein
MMEPAGVKYRWPLTFAVRREDKAQHDEVPRLDEASVAELLEELAFRRAQSAAGRGRAASARRADNGRFMK